MGTRGMPKPFHIQLLPCLGAKYEALAHSLCKERNAECDKGTQVSNLARRIARIALVVACLYRAIEKHGKSWAPKQGDISAA
jgi:hypothetical protein